MPNHHSNRSVAALMAVAATLPFTILSSQAGEGGYSGMSGLAEREIIRRQEAVTEADRLFADGREAYAKLDYQQAVDKFRSALSILPDAPTLSDRRASYTDHLSRASVALAQEFRKVGKYDEARALLDGVLSPDVDPNNFAAKAELGYLDDPIRTNPALTYEHTKNVDEVRRGLYMAQGNFDLGKFDAAKTDYEAVLRTDPYNRAARRGMERIAAAKTDYYRAAYDQTRAELLMQVDRAWELSVPADLPDLGDFQTGSTQASDGVAYITEKLRRIVIPRIDFEDTSVEEAIDFLTLRAAELDTLELDPDKKGINFVIRRPRTTEVGAGLGGLDAAEGNEPLLGGGDPGSLRIDSLRLRNVPLAVALKYICDATKLRYKVDDYAVTLVPQTETGEDLFTRTFRVPPDFAATLSAGGEGGAAVESDPFSDSAGETRSLLQPRLPIIELLKNAGVVFSEGSSATLGASGTLLITNTPSELDKIEQLIEASSVGQPKQVKITTKFVEITQENNEELGFDWIVSPFGLSANSVFGTGGTIGSGAPRVGADFISPVPTGGTPIPGIGGPDDLVSNIVTGGLRSGDQAVNRNSIDAILNNPGRTAQAQNVAPGILGLTGIFGDAEVQVMMRGLSQKKGIDLMTAPSITARSGQKATIEVIREFIYPTEYDPPELPPASNSTLGGGSAGIATPANPTAFETKNTGVTLEIEPTIGENDFVIDLRFLPEIVEFEGFINYGSPIQTTVPIFDVFGAFLGSTTATITENRIEMPVFSKRSVNTSLTIYDGYTVAVGGLMREDVQNVEDKVPILGDIPLIGRLFQSKSENHIKSNLIIFVTAQIIDATGRPLRGADSGGAVPVSTAGGADDLGVLPPLDLPE